MHDYVVLDVFTRTPLEGNPLAVFLDAAGLDAGTMQRAARELNLSETVFLAAGDGDHDAALRIFTPRAELPFAGHPTLGSAFVVGRRTGRDRLRLATGAGTVEVRLTREGEEIVDGEMDQPLPREQSLDADAEAAVLRAVGVKGSELPVGAYRNGPLHVYVALSDPAAVDALAPDLGVLASLGDVDVACFAVTGTRVESRNFVPGLGVPEDPATGSAAGPLAVHLARHGVISYGDELDIQQGRAMGRPSRLRARAEGSPARLERVVVGGGAVLVGEGRYRFS